MLFVFALAALSAFSVKSAFGQYFEPLTGSRCLNPNQRVGVCVSIYECQTLLPLIGRPLDEEFLLASKCRHGFGYPPYVCCSRDTGFTRNTFDYQNSASAALPRPPTCGRWTMSNRINSDTDSDPNEFPWLVQLVYKSNEGVLKTSCAGSLITNRYVVTVAHCVKGLNKEGVSLIAVGLGEYGSLRVDIEKIIPHEEYYEGSPNFKNDIALIRLAQKIRFSHSLRPICLPSVTMQEWSVPDSGTLYTLAVWGDKLSPKKRTKQELQVPLVDLEECQRKFWEINVDVLDSQICAGGVEDEDSCKGDSGSPLMRFRNDAWVLEGIISFGRGCGRSGWPAVHTRVASFENWIINNIEI